MTAIAVEDPLKAVRALFDAAFYRERYPDLVEAEQDPFDHFMRWGWRESRDPSADFSTARYAELHPDVAAAEINPFVHYVLYGRDEARRTAVSGTEPPPHIRMPDVHAAFDSAFYRSQNPDIGDRDPFEHFITAGWTEGRDPHPGFSVADYLAANRDVAHAGLEPFTHYIRHGRDEGRPLRVLLAPNSDAPDALNQKAGPVRAAFDEAHYRASGTDLAGVKDPFVHFMETGWREGKDPNAWFSVSRYVDSNADVEASGINPFEHYILYGRHEGRPLTSGLDYRGHILRRAVPFEDHVQSLRRASPDPEPEPIDQLTKTLEALKSETPLHVTVSQDNFVDAFGGIQLCIRLESAAVRAEGANHIHLFPPAVGMVVDVERDLPPIGVVLNTVFMGYFAVDALTRSFLDRPVERVSFAVHSLIGHTTPGIVAVLQAMGATDGFYWVHDYSSLCAGYTLMRNDVSFCGAPPPESAACSVCQYRPRRRVQMREHGRLFEAFSITVLAPSDSALTLWRRSFPLRPAGSVAHPHATLTPRRTPRLAASEAPEPFRVGFLGMATHHKGWPAFSALAESCHGDARYQFHHLARHPGNVPSIEFTSVAPTADNPEPMQKAVEGLQLDVVVIWSLWPETFCFTALEAVAGGAVVVTNPASGNVTAFVRREGGLIVDSEDALIELFRSGEILKQARRVRKPRLQTLNYSRMTADFLGEATT